MLIFFSFELHAPQHLAPNPIHSCLRLQEPTLGSDPVEVPEPVPGKILCRSRWDHLQGQSPKIKKNKSGKMTNAFSGDYFQVPS